MDSQSVVIRFAGDSGDGVQLIGTQFVAATALAGDDFATFPDYPAEIRAPAGTTFGVSAYQIHLGARPITTAGDAPQVLVAFNPAALKVNLPLIADGALIVLNIDSFTLFASAVLVSLERGGRITDSLERISHSLQEVQRIERKLEVDTASGKKVVYILTGFPIFFLGLSYFMNPEGTATVFQSLLGQLVLLVIIGLCYFSFRWSQKILTIEV